MIIIFNIKRLARKLAYNELRETHKLFYFIVPLIFIDITHANDMIQLARGYELAESPISPLRLADTVYDVLVMGVGLIWMWLINRQGDQRYFIERFICLSFPILVYLQIVSWIFHFALLNFMKNLSPYGVISLVFSDILMLVYFFVLGYWIRRTSHKQI